MTGSAVAAALCTVTGCARGFAGVVGGTVGEEDDGKADTATDGGVTAESAAATDACGIGAGAAAGAGADGTTTGTVAAAGLGRLVCVDRVRASRTPPPTMMSAPSAARAPTANAAPRGLCWLETCPHEASVAGVLAAGRRDGAT